MSCPLVPADCVGDLAGGITDSVTSAAWDTVCKSFADAAGSLMKAFAEAFVAIPPVDLTSSGIRNVYSISLGIAVFVSALLLIGQVIRTALTHDGSALAHGLVGVGKATLACLLTLTVAGTCLRAADELSNWIVVRTFGSTDELSKKIAVLVAWQPNGVPSSLLLIIAVVGIAVTIVLWFEMLLRNAAVAVVIGTAPIPAAGQTAQATAHWWPKLVGVATQLIVLKPVIALVFCVGLSYSAGAGDIESLLAGLLVLLLAVVAWPVIARFFTFASVQVGGGAGLGALLGFTAGRLTADGGASGVDPSEFSRVAEARTMRSAEVRGGLTPDGGTAEAGGAAARASGPARGAAAGAGDPVATVAFGLGMAQRAVNSVTGRMEQMAGHAGLQGANPYAQPAGHPRHSGAVPFDAFRRRPDAGGTADQSTVAGFRPPPVPGVGVPTRPGAAEEGFLLPDHLAADTAADTAAASTAETGSPDADPGPSGLGFAAMDEEPASEPAPPATPFATEPGPPEAGFTLSTGQPDSAGPGSGSEMSRADPVPPDPAAASGPPPDPGTPTPASSPAASPPGTPPGTGTQPAPAPGPSAPAPRGAPSPASTPAADRPAPPSGPATPPSPDPKRGESR